VLQGYWTSRAQSYFQSIWPFENNFESSPKNLTLGSSEILPLEPYGCEGQRAPSPRWAAKGHRLKHVATRLPPAGPHADILCATAGGITTVETSAPPHRHFQRLALVKGKSSQGSRITVQIEKYLLCSAAQLTSCSSPAVTAPWLT
jgi:hypothetical protein